MASPEAKDGAKTMQNIQKYMGTIQIYQTDQKQQN